MFKLLVKLISVASLLFWLGGVQAQSTAAPASAAARDDYLVGAGDVVRITVFQNRDLDVEARVSENGVISFPLVGVVKIGGLSPTAAEQLIAKRLRDGNFLQNPQVTLNITQFRSQQVAVLGNVTRRGVGMRCGQCPGALAECRVA